MDKILELEKSLFKIEYMNNYEYLNNLIDDNYLECGKSGKLFTKQDIINELTSLSCDRDITIYNYSNQQIGDIYLVHYITLHNDNKYYRTSIWSKECKLLFHQASLLNEDINLIEY